MKSVIACFLFSFSYSVIIHAARIDTVQTFSPSMNKQIPALIVTPDNYHASKPLPVVYLLHGYSGSALDGWIKKEPEVELFADIYQMILVVPDGGFSSWYFDSPVDKSFCYETYITRELIPFVDENYSTIAQREGRAITGLSMGGHGALYLSVRHQDLFGAAGSMSGGVDIRPFPDNWDIAKRLGKYSEHPENWEKNTVINLADSLQPNSLALIIDCGTEDFFYQVNCQLHEKLLKHQIPHDFISRPGKHNWPYWLNAIQYQMLFFKNYFEEKH